MFSITTEIYYDGEWHDISADVMNTQLVNVKRGIQNEGSRQTISPGSATLRLNNGVSNVEPTITGRYSLKNPRSDLFGKIGRNTPIRQYIGTKHVGETNFDLTDTTDQVAPSVDAPTDEGILICAWAAPDGSGTYTNPGSMEDGGTTSDSNMSLGSAYEAISSSGATGTRTATFSASEDYVSASALLNGPSSTANVSISTGFSTGISPTVPSASTAWWVVVTAFVWGEFNTFGAGREDEFPAPYFPSDTDGGGWTLLSESEVQRPADAQAEYFQIKVWAKKIKTAGTHTISIENPDNQLDSIQSVLYQVVNVEDWSIRFNHEVTKWPPKWGLAGKNDSWMPITTKGVTDRFGRPEYTLEDVVKRWAARDTRLVGYWPFDDPIKSTGAKPSVGDQVLQRDYGQSRDQSWRKGEFFPWLGPGLNVDRLGSTDAVSTADVLTLRAGVKDIDDDFVIDILYKGSPSESDDDDVVARFGLETRPNSSSGVFNWSLVIEGGFQAGNNPEIRVRARDTVSTTIDTTGLDLSDLFSNFAIDLLDGEPHHIRWSVTESGSSADISVIIDTVEVLTDTYATGVGVPATERVGIDFRGGVTGSSNKRSLPISVAHMMLWGSTSASVDDLFNVHQGLSGEKPIERFRRICFEEKIPYSFIGDPDDEEVILGPQYPGQLISVIRDATSVGNGLWYEAREFRGWTYRSISTFYNRSSILELDYSAQHVSEPFDPTEDTQNTTNDVSGTRRDGGSDRLIKTSGPLNTSDPTKDPEGIGVIDKELTPDPNVILEGNQLLNQIRWALLLGTQDEYRFPEIRLDLRNLELRSLDPSAQARLVDVGDRFTVDNPPDFSMPPELIDQLLLGYTESYSIERWEIRLHGAPYAPYRTAELEHDDFQFIGSDGSTLGADFVAGTDTSMTVDIAEGYPLWEYEADFDIFPGGVRLTVTAISGSSSPQTFTVTQAPVNGVEKTLEASDNWTVDVFHKSYIGL